MSVIRQYARQETPAERTRRLKRSGEKRRADGLRRELLLLLAPDGRCAKCRVKPRRLPLEVDHTDGRHDWQPSRLNREARFKRYLQEYASGVRLRALCRKCNGGHRNNLWRQK